MHPVEVIELMIAGGILFVILLVSFILKGKWRKVIQGLAILYLVSFGIFYIARPYWIDLQIEKKWGWFATNPWISFFNKTWEFWTVPHREDEYKHMNPYIIGVIFDTEPEVEYDYSVRNKDDIIQPGYSIKNEFKSDLLHLDVLD